jgi:nucleoside 2-deoxyribosyltransferase
MPPQQPDGLLDGIGCGLELGAHGSTIDSMLPGFSNAGGSGCSDFHVLVQLPNWFSTEPIFNPELWRYGCIPRSRAMKKIEIYLAGPLFTTAEREFNAELARRLRRDYAVVLPQESQKRDTPPQQVFERDVGAIEHADVVVANMDGPDPDSGTCWECGYARARNKAIVLYRTDLRGIKEPNQSPFNLMLVQSATKLVEFTERETRNGCPSMETIVLRIRAALNSNEVRALAGAERGRRRQRDRSA